MAQDAYVWQRAWTDPVREAVRQQGGRFGSVVVLAAEVTWTPAGPKPVRVDVDYEELRRLGRPVGIALRIGAYRGAFDEDDQTARWLADLAASLWTRAVEAGVEIGEIQLDFDCPESKLAGYARWVRAIRSRHPPAPVTITALPCWLDRRAFRELAGQVNHYVLQVHSFQRPRGPDGPFTLCDPAAARRAVEQAGRIGAPFRVALPTYSYLAAFDPDGGFVGVSAEGPAQSWPEGAILRTVEADPAAMAALVRGWTRDRPAAMTGVIWYRLPTRADRMNWPWPTLEAVMAGRTPAPSLQAVATRGESGTVEIELANVGDAASCGRVTVEVRYRGTLEASDALGGFQRVDDAPGRMVFSRSEGPAGRLGPGRRMLIGWIRLGSDTEVSAHVIPADP